MAVLRRVASMVLPSVALVALVVHLTVVFRGLLLGLVMVSQV